MEGNRRAADEAVPELEGDHCFIKSLPNKDATLHAFFIINK